MTDTVVREWIEEIAEMERTNNGPKHFKSLWLNGGDEFTSILSEEYKREYDVKEDIYDTSTIRTLYAIDLLEESFKKDFTEPERTAHAMLKLLDTLDDYVKGKAILEIVRANDTPEGLKEETEYREAKNKLNVELLLS